MGRGSIVISPDGRRWRVGRRWVERHVPSLRDRFRRGREEVDGEGIFDGLLVADAVEGWGVIGIAIAVGFLVLVLLPLLGVALGGRRRRLRGTGGICGQGLARFQHGAA